MRKKKDNTWKAILAFELMFFLILALIGATLYYKYCYETAIQVGADNTVVALKLVIACENLTGITHKEVEKRAMEMFIEEKLQEDDNGISK